MPSATPFFTNAQGEHQKSVYHSMLCRQSSLMLKFKQTPFDSKFPRPGTPGKIVYIELDDGYEYIYQIENDAIVQTLDQVEPDQWYRVTASGKGEEATLQIDTSGEAESYKQQERAAIAAEPAVAKPTAAAPPPSGNGLMPTHLDCTDMTVETVTAFEAVGTVLESDAIARIYNTHFIALSKQKGGLIR